MDKHIDVSVDGVALGNLACNEGAALRKCIEMGKQVCVKVGIEAKSGCKVPDHGRIAAICVCNDEILDV